MDEVPLLMKSEDVKDVKKVVSVVFTSLPSNFGEFIKWIAEVRRREDGNQNLSPEENGRLALKVLYGSTLHFSFIFFFPFMR